MSGGDVSYSLSRATGVDDVRSGLITLGVIVLVVVAGALLYRRGR